MGKANQPATGATVPAQLMTCSDFAGRQRTVSVYAARGQVVMVAPPAEVAIMTGAEVDQLCAALIQAKAELTPAAQTG
jgi:hypothetical protein